MEEIKNKKDFYEALDFCVDIRKELNNVHWVDMNDIKTIFSLVFNEDNRVFKLVKDMIHYQGGWPSPDSPPKLDVKIDDIAAIIKYYTYMGMFDIIDEKFKQHGIFVQKPSNVEDEIQNRHHAKVLKKSEFKKLKYAWNQLYNEELPANFDLKNLCIDIFEKATKKQGIICNKADIIKIDTAPAIENACNIPKKMFCEKVNINAKKTDKISIIKEKKLEDLKKNIDVVEL